MEDTAAADPYDRERRGERDPDEGALGERFAAVGQGTAEQMRGGHWVVDH